jgi:hypothetical protein
MPKDERRLTDKRRKQQQQNAERKQRLLLEEALIDAENRLASVLKTLPALVPAPPLILEPQVPQSSTPVEVVAMFGDWHIGCRTRRDETLGLGQYSVAIAAQRLRYWTKKFLKWVAAQRRCYNITRCTVLGLADWVHGLIHLDNLVDADMEPVPSAVAAGQMLATVVRDITQAFESVRVVSLAADNHGRLTTKVLSSRRGVWSLGHVVNAVAMAMLRDIPNVQFNGVDSISAETVIAEHRFLVMHGNDIRGWMGIPHYGIWRRNAMEHAARGLARRPAIDYLVLGHFHTPSFSPGVIMNGALCGTTTYDHSQGRHSPACQAAFLVHPLHGVFNFLPLRVEKEHGNTRKRTGSSSGAV